MQTHPHQQSTQTTASSPRPRSFSAVCQSLARLSCALALVLSVAFTSAIAQETATGTVRGKVQNASNGKYLENALVTVAGTNQQVRTNSFGDYEIKNLPAGEVSLRASYVGEPDLTTTVTVAAGEVANKDFTFRETAATKRADDGTIILDPFVVSAERYRNAQAVALAEERNSINIKNVVSIDQFGAIPSGNVGEFVKFMPGVMIDYGASNGNNQGYSENAANGVSVRGFGPEDTTILIDGLPVASTLPGSLTRQTGLDQLSINNAARVELIKVATPDMPANSIGGQVNLVTRTAFEYPKPTYTAKVFFNISSMNPDLGKTPGPTNKDTFKTSPGFEASVNLPVNDRFGISVSGNWAQEYSQSYRAQPTWNNSWASNYNAGAFTNAAGQASSLSNPVLTRYQITDSPAMTERQSANFKVDWKPTPNQTIRANVQYSTYETAEAQRRLDFRPAIANGIVWDGTQVVGNNANSTTAMSITTRDRIGDTVSAQLKYDATFFGFKIGAAGSISKSVSDFVDEENGHFSGVDLNLNPGRVALYGLNQGIPSSAETFTRTTALPLSYTVLSNWALDGTTAKSGESHNETEKSLYKVDVSRPLDFLPFLGNNTLSISAGYRYDDESNLKSGRGTGYRQILRPGAAYTVADILDTNYIGQSPGFGLAPQQWASTYKLYEINQAKDIFYVPDFDETTNTRVENYNSFVGQQKDLKESTDAWYGMLSGRFFSNRLSFVGGLRQESRKRVGRTSYTDNKWNYVKNKDGSIYTNATYTNGVRMDQSTSDLFATTAAGSSLRSALSAAGISFPTTPYGSPTSGVRDLAARMLQYQPLRPINTSQDGDPSYSLSTAFQLTKKIDLKAAYSRSFGLPDFEAGPTNGLLSAATSFTITEYTATEQLTQNGALGQIQVANPNLKPEVSNNWDFEASYHTDHGGKFTLSYYTKEVTDQVQNYTTYSYSDPATFSAVMGALGLDPTEFDGWRVITSTNSSTIQKTDGWEAEIRQDLGFLGTWGRRVSGFVSYSWRDFPPVETPVPVTFNAPDGSTVTFTPAVSTVTLRSNKSGGAGIQYSGNRLTAQIRGTYRNDNETDGRVTLANGNFLRRFQPAETRIDVNVNYALSKTYSLFLSGRDVFNGERDVVWRDDQGLLADYSTISDRKRFGVAWTVGVSGNW